MGDHQKKLPKYTFGLIETPYAGQVLGSSTTSSSNVHPERGSTSRSDDLTGQMRGPSTSTTRQTTESFGSSSVPRRPSSFCTPATGRSSARSRTPGSRYGQYTSSSASDMSSSNIVAIVEGRGLARGEIGIASIDLKRPVLQLSQFSDSQTNVKVMTKLQILQPLEIIMPNTACENGNMTKLFRLISEQFHNCNLATVQRRYFNETKGLQYIRHLCVPEFNTVEMEVRTKYYCLASVAALLKYVEFIQNAVYAPASLKIVFKGCEQTTMIDAATNMSLELLQNTRDVKSDHTLFGTLNYTRTPMGARLLRCNILQPPNNLETVSMRLDAVAELTDNEELFYSLQAVVGRFLDVDHLLSLCIQIPKQETVKTAESKITNIIHLKHSLELVEPLQLALKDSHSKLLCAYASVLEDPRFNVIMEKIHCVINEDTVYQKGLLNMRTQKCFAVKVLEDPRFNVIMEKIHCVINEDTVYQKGLLNMRTQKCFAVKPHINGLLDVARRTYTEIVDDIAEMVEQLRNEYNLPMTSAYNSTRGFHLQIHSHNKTELPDITSLPPCFTKVTRSKNSLTFTNTDLIRMNERVKESLQEIYLMTNIVVTELLTDIRVHLGCLYKLTECISMIDMIVAFAHNCTLFHYVRPEFTDTIAIKQGRHPILEKITVDAITPNNVYASEESNFVVITGPNMSGKSTYLRQIALLQIMAQIGSYVPAEYASFRLTDQIFSRIGSDDDIETNASTFVMEMRETNYIVQNATASSLIIIDELGRGTSADEGVGICHAICEYLLNLKAFVFFATHFMQLTNLESLYPNVENYHFDVQEVFGEHGQCSKVTYTHVLSKGKTRQKHYGLQLAEMSTLPAEVLQDARCLAEQISAQRETKAPLSAAAVKERADFRLSKRLLQTALNSRLDEESLRSYLRALKEQYLKELQESVTSAED